MALQGTLDTFSLPDVLRLLATTGKSGCLHIDGDRGRGSVWIDRGAVVAADADRARGEAPIDEKIFEMLRFQRGSFNFAADERSPSPGEPAEIEGALRRAGQLHDEWRELESVVPSLSHRVAMAPELTVEQVTIDAARWEALVAIASGRSVGELAETLGQGELGISRTVSDLVELGVAVVEAPAPGRAGASRRSGMAESAPPVRTNSPDLPRRPGRNDHNGGGRREPSPSMPLSDGLTSGINWAQSAEAGTLADPGDDALATRTPSAPVGAGRKPSSASVFNDTGSNGLNSNGMGANGLGANGLGSNGSNGLNGRSSATPAGGVGVATPAGGNHLEIPPKAPRRSASGRPSRSRRTGPTPAALPPTTPPPLPPRNGQALAPMPSPAYPTTDVAERERPATNGRARKTPPAPGAADFGRGAPIPAPPPEPTRGPLLPPSLDTGRLGPSPLPLDTGQIPVVTASSLPPDVSWAVEDNKPTSLSSPFAGLGKAAPSSGPGAAPGRLLQSQPSRPSQQVVMPQAPLLPPPHAAPITAPRTPSNGYVDNGEPAAHVVAMSPDARAAVEATVGRSGGGPTGLQMAGLNPDQMMNRGQLLIFLSTVR